MLPQPRSRRRVAPRAPETGTASVNRHALRSLYPTSPALDTHPPVEQRSRSTRQVSGANRTCIAGTRLRNASITHRCPYIVAATRTLRAGVDYFRDVQPPRRGLLT